MRKLLALAFLPALAAFAPSPYAITLEPTEGDNTPALNAAAKAVCTSATSRTIYLSAGEFHFLTRPDPFNCALNLVGEGKGATRLVRDYSGGSFLAWTRGTDHSGGSLRDVNVEAGPETQGGIAVYVQAIADTDGTVNSYNRHSFSIDNVQVGRVNFNASWDFGLYLDGALNPDGNPNSVPGIRGVYVTRSSFGGTNTANVYLNMTRGADLNVECYTPLKGSAAAVWMANGTQSVRLETRNCSWKMDDTSSVLILNGQKVTGASGSP